MTVATLGLTKVATSFLRPTVATTTAERAVLVTTANNTVTNGEKVIIYRVFGGDSRAQGFSWTPTNPQSVSNFRNLAGLPSGGESGSINTANFMITGEVYVKDIIKWRSALPLDGNSGGLPEYIVDPRNVNIIDFTVLNP